jgi:hypothetical protein
VFKRIVVFVLSIVTALTILAAPAPAQARYGTCNQDWVRFFDDGIDQGTSWYYCMPFNPYGTYRLGISQTFNDRTSALCMRTYPFASGYAGSFAVTLYDNADFTSPLRTFYYPAWSSNGSRHCFEGWDWTLNDRMSAFMLWWTDPSGGTG